MKKEQRYEGTDSLLQHRDLFPAQTLTYIGKKYKPDLLTMAIATDYTSIPFWEETRLGYYVIPHRDLTREFYRKGLPREKLLPFGIPVSASFTRHSGQGEARRALGLPEEGFEILIMSGSVSATFPMSMYWITHSRYPCIWTAAV